MSRFLRPSGPQNLREFWHAIWKGFQRVETELGDGVPEGGYPEPPDPAPSPPDGQQRGAHSHYLDNLINVNIAAPGAPAGSRRLLSGQVLTFKDDLNYWENATVACEVIPTGLVDGGELNIGPGANDIEVIAGVGVVMDSYTDPDGPPQAKGVSWGQINQAITQVPAAGNLAYFTIIPVTPETDGPVAGTVLGELREYDTVPPDQVQRRDEIPLGLVVFNGDVWGEISSPTVINNAAHTLEDYLNSVAGPSFIIEGGEVTEAPAHAINQSSGTVWEQNRNWHVNKKDPHREAFLARTPLQFRYTNRDFSDVGVLGSTVDVTQWDDGGTVSPIGGGSQQATVQRVYIDPRDNVWILWGQNVYPSYAEAVSKIGADTADTEVPGLLARASILLCYIVSRRNQTDWGVESTIVIPEGGSGGGGSPFTPTTFSGALTTGYVPDPLTESERTLIDDGTWQNRGHFKTYVAGSTYYPQDVVYDGQWLMVANTETLDNPFPQTVGDPTYALPDVPLFQDFENISVVGSGHLYTFNTSGYYRGLRVWVPETGPDITYRITAVRNPNSANPSYSTLTNPILDADGWTTLSVDTVLLLEGEGLLVYIEALNSGGSVSPGGTPADWIRETSSNTAQPLAGNWNTNVQESVLRISEVDADGNPEINFLGVIPGSTFEFVSTTDPTVSVTYTAISAETYDPLNGSYEWIVSVTSTGAGGTPQPTDRTVGTIIVPVAATTKFVGIPGYWNPTTLPTWATITSNLQYDGVDQPVVGDEAYGIDVAFQELTKSDDWDIYGLPSGGGGGGGGGGGTSSNSSLLAAIQELTVRVEALENGS